MSGMPIFFKISKRVITFRCMQYNTHFIYTNHFYIALAKTLVTNN